MQVRFLSPIASMRRWVRGLDSEYLQAEGNAGKVACSYGAGYGASVSDTDVLQCGAEV